VGKSPTPTAAREDTARQAENRGQLPLLDIRYTTTNPMIPRATMLRLKMMAEYPATAPRSLRVFRDVL